MTPLDSNCIIESLKCHCCGFSRDQRRQLLWIEPISIEPEWILRLWLIFGLFEWKKCSRFNNIITINNYIISFHIIIEYNFCEKKMKNEKLCEIT